MKTVILLDLNYTLVANSTEKRSPFIEQIAHEQYRIALLEFVRAYAQRGRTEPTSFGSSFAQFKAAIHDYQNVLRTVILVTARPIKYKEATLLSIKDKTCIEFAEAYFNDTKLQPAWFKRKVFIEKIKPKYGEANYVAIESNPKTIAEYKKTGVLCLSVM